MAKHDYDDWYSAIVSFVVHFCLTMILSLFSNFLRSHEMLPPAVAVVQVVETSVNLSDSIDELPFNDLPEMIDASFPLQIPSVTAEDLIAVEPVDLPRLDATSPNDRHVREILDDARQAAEAAKTAARKQLDENLTTSSIGGRRAERATRWVITFNPCTIADYVRQMGGLGAELAFLDDDGQYVYFTNLNGSPKRSRRNLSSENRLYWLDADAATAQRVAHYLNAPSDFFNLMFLPTSLEDRMLRMELEFNGVTDESRIANTTYECIPSGTGCDVRVISQTLKQ